MISNKAEHHAVLNALEHLEKHEGFEVTWLNVSRDGIVDLDQLAAAIRPETRLVSIMAANNETGVIQPMREISEICRAQRRSLHSDMVQSFGKIDIDDLSLVDAASFAAHKFYGPKGAGLLFLRSGLSIQPIMFGGAHENERRPGTENVAAIAGMAAAAEFALRDREAEQDRQLHLREDLWQRIEKAFPAAAQQNGDAIVSANTLNVSFPGIDSETMLMALDLEGVCASSGSACMVGSVVASHVLLAMGLPMERASSAIRFSLGKWTTAEEIETAGATHSNADFERTNYKSKGTATRMPLLRQLEFVFSRCRSAFRAALRRDGNRRLPTSERTRSELLENLRRYCAGNWRKEVRVEWNARLKSCAGRAIIRRN